MNSDLMELCWENGHVVLNAQPQTHPPTDHMIQETATVSWLDDPCFDKDFFSEFPLDEEAHRCSNLPSMNHPPPPRFGTSDHRSHQDVVPSEAVVSSQADHNCFRSQNKGCCNVRTRETVASSHCGSNQGVFDAVDGSQVSSSGIAVAANKPRHGDVGKKSSLQSEKIQTLITSSSSGGSQSSFGRTTSNSHKRKSRDVAEDSECQSEDAELESAPRKKAGLKSRKSRAAEVHNLSERRRRDRINEKMRILQELLPHSNKTDKASMLDEAIEYMKSLQQQLQMMWMGSGMAAAPFMFPGVQHYMSRVAGMGMGMGRIPLPPHQNPMHFARLPLQQQQQAPRMPNAACQGSSMMPDPQQFANYMQFQAMQRASQVNAALGFGPKAAGPPGNNQ